MEVACYVCNKCSTIYQQNLTEIKSNHSGKQVCDFIKQLTRDFATTRDVEDESNCICGDCLQKVFVYDWACVEAEKQEKKLIELLLATEKIWSKRRVEIKVEKDVDVCHTESIFVEENHNLVGEEIDIKTEPTEQMDEDDFLMDEELNTHKITTPIAETQEKANKVIEQPNHLSTDKTMFIQKDGKLVKVRLVKKCSNGGPSINNLLKTKDGKIVTIKLEGNQTLAQAPIETRKNVPMFAKPIPSKIVVSSQTPKQPEKSIVTETLTTPIIRRIISQPKIVVSSCAQNQTPITLPINVPTQLSINVPSRMSAQAITQTPMQMSIQRQYYAPNPIPRPMPTQAEIQRQIAELESSMVRRTVPLKTFTRECKICDDGTKYSKKGYCAHMKNHKIACQMCDMKFVRAKPQRIHMKWHESNPGFICRFCYHEVEDKTLYKEHLELHKDKDPSACVFCEGVYCDKRSLRKHVEVQHNKNSDHLCDVCGRKFSYNSSLLFHKAAVHIEGRPEKCTKCPKTFTHKIYLERHMETHTITGRPFSCSICNVKFKHQKYLTAHEKRHKKDTKTLKCSLCPAAYEHKFHLKEHIKRKHRAEVPSGQLDNTESNTQE